MINEINLKHGAVSKPFDIRDHKYHRIAAAPIPFDWNKGFDIEAKLGFKLTVEDQGNSSSCGGQALRYLLEALKSLRTHSFDRLSARYTYSQIFYPGGGTDSRRLGNIAVKLGTCQESIVASYENGKAPSEPFMENKGDNTPNATRDAALNKEQAYAFVKPTMESIAQAMRDNGGVILMVEGENNGTWLSSYPQPPKSVEWRHFLYAGKTKTIAGKRYIGVLNSWGSDVGEGGWQWLSEDWFNGSVIEVLVLYDTILFSYDPTLFQKAFSWLNPVLQKLFYWFSNFNQVDINPN